MRKGNQVIGVNGAILTPSGIAVRFVAGRQYNGTDGLEYHWNTNLVRNGQMTCGNCKRKVWQAFVNEDHYFIYCADCVSEL